jgi:hypothetical protein
MTHKQKIHHLRAEDDSLIGVLSLRIRNLVKENNALKASMGKMKKNNLMKQNEYLESRVKELEYLHSLDQSEIVRLRRIIGTMDGE